MSAKDARPNKMSQDISTRGCTYENGLIFINKLGTLDLDATTRRIIRQVAVRHVMKSKRKQGLRKRPKPIQYTLLVPDSFSKDTSSTETITYPGALPMMPLVNSDLSLFFSRAVDNATGDNTRLNESNHISLRNSKPIDPIHESSESTEQRGQGISNARDDNVGDFEHVVDLTRSHMRYFDILRIKQPNSQYITQEENKKRVRISNDDDIEFGVHGMKVERLTGEFSDPFNCLPSAHHKDNSLLVHHYNTIFVQTTTPPGRRKLWFAYALSDPVLFSATLFISASHLSAVRKSCLLPAFYYHRGICIRGINERLSANGGSTASDSTIGAIAALLVSDSLAGHPERVKAHMQGLQQLVVTRGGIEMLNPLVSELLGWADVLASNSLQAAPTFVFTRLVNPDLLVYYRSPSASTVQYATTWSTRLVNFTSLLTASELAAQVYWGLRNITLEREVEGGSSSLSASIQFSDRTETLEREILRLIYLVLPPAPDPQSKIRSSELPLRLFAYASLIYVGVVLRDLLYNGLTAMLAQHLELLLDIPDAHLNELLGSFPDLLLWVFFLCGASLKAGSSKVWFAKSAARLLRVMNIDELEDIKGASTRFLWPETAGRKGYDPKAADIGEITTLLSGIASMDEMGLEIDHSR